MVNFEHYVIASSNADILYIRGGLNERSKASDERFADAHVVCVARAGSVREKAASAGPEEPDRKDRRAAPEK